MAKADDEATGWIWLREALERAKLALGSEALAQQRLVEWLATAKLPWSCRSWQGFDATGLAKLKRERTVVLPTRESAYHEGDPQFWSVPGLEIHWADNVAREPVIVVEIETPYGRTFARFAGAQAWGIRVSRERLDALLPERPQNEQPRGSGAWIAAELKDMMEAGEIPPDIRIRPLSRKLERRMQKAADTNKSLRPITARTIENGLRDWGLWPIISIK